MTNVIPQVYSHSPLIISIQRDYHNYKRNSAHSRKFTFAFI